LQSLLAIPFQAAETSLEHLRAFVQQLETALDDPAAPFDKASAIKSISKILPEFTHIETHRTLDDRR
jgi:hypothetical protein